MPTRRGRAENRAHLKAKARAAKPIDFATDEYLDRLAALSDRVAVLEVEVKELREQARKPRIISQGKRIAGGAVARMKNRR